MIQHLQPLWAYRSFVAGSVKREFQARYSNSLLGATWAVVSPLGMILIYTIIFSQIMRARLPGIESHFGYGIYLCAGIITWGLFTDILGRGLNVFLDNASLLKKLSFPRLTLPTVVVCSALVNFSIIFSLFLLVLLLLGQLPGWPLLGLVPLLVLQTLFAISLGLMLGVVNVFFRDVGQFFGVALHFWFWLTPIVYPIDILPEPLQALMVLNPLVPLISGYQSILAFGQWPAWGALWYPAALTVLFSLLGWRLYRQCGGEMVDEL